MGAATRTKGKTVVRAFHFVMGMALTGILSGCGRDGGTDRAARAPVSGKMTLDNRPLAGAKVVFTPSGSTVGNSVAAYTDAEGQYQFKSIQGAAGVPPGEYKVVVSRRLLEDGALPPPGTKTAEAPVRESLPPSYSNPDVTTLTATVTEQGGTIDFPLKSQGSR